VVTFLSPYPRERYWLVRPGDSFDRIARLTGVSVATLRRLNPHINPWRLRAGTWLVLPWAYPRGPVRCPIIWTVRAGDTFWSIARALGMPAWRVQAANPGVGAWGLTPGRNLCLPR
jgi:LysM repeat protein